ncbi:MAG: Uma2 family endonuclease [Acidobacteriota bacterium]
MTRRPQRHYSLDEYFAVEASSSIKHEYYDGEIFAVAGASVAHNHISANVLAALRVGLRGSDCSAFGGDLRVKTRSGLYTYPDVMVICGKIELTRDQPDTATNPCAIIEVLSDATQNYDRGDKFTLYKTIPALRDYLLIDQKKIFVEHFRLNKRGVWKAASFPKLSEEVSLSAIDVALPLSEIYERVFV